MSNTNIQDELCRKVEEVIYGPDQGYYTPKKPVVTKHTIHQLVKLIREEARRLNNV